MSALRHPKRRASAFVRRTARIALALTAVAFGGCGAGASETDRHALYASLQVEEARVAAAEHRVVEGPCDGRALACDEACDASGSAGEIASRLGERDARIRAEHAERTCSWCRAQPSCHDELDAAATGLTEEPEPAP